MQPDSNQPKGNKRSRAIALNERGLTELHAAIEEIWKRDHAAARLTRALTAEIIGLSIKTSDRVCDGQPVDRGSLVTAFSAVGLEFSDAHTGPIAPPFSEAKPEPSSRDGRRVAFVFSAVVFFVLVALGATAARPKPVSMIYSPEYRVEELLASALNDYHSARYETARSKFVKALAQAREARDVGGIAEAHKGLGELAMFDGDYAQAEELFAKALALVDSAGMKHHLPRVHQLLGQAQERQGNRDEARENYLDSLKGFTEMPDDYASAMVQVDLGGLELDSGDLSSAEALFLTSHATLTRLQKPNELAALTSDMAQLEAKRGNFGAALALLSDALSHWEAEGHPRWQAKTHLEFARVYRLKGDEKAARNSASASAALYREVGDGVGEDKANRLLDPVSQTGQDQGS